MRVFITIDTEPPIPRPGKGIDVRALIAEGVYGECREADIGLRYIARILAEHDLKAVFFTEALHASAFPETPLRDIVRDIEGRGHEVGLHVHSEWLEHLPKAAFDGRAARNVGELPADVQTRVIAAARDNLLAAGSSDIFAFRAGNYGAGNATLRALAHCGIPFDSSYNQPYLGGDCMIETPASLTGPAALEGAIEVPVTAFRDYPGHVRPLQLCACSMAEIRHVLSALHRTQAPAAVLVLHSFELMNRAKTRIERIVHGRFLELCRFLNENRDRFQTAGFGDVLEWREAPPPAPPIVGSSVLRTLRRMSAQASGALLYGR